MDQKQIIKQMVDFNMTIFNNAYQSLISLQDQFQRNAINSLDQTTWFPEDGKNTIENWVKAYNNSQNDFKKYIDMSCEKMTDYFSD